MKLHKSHRLFAKIAHKLGYISEIQLHETVSLCQKTSCSQHLQNVIEPEAWNKVRLIYLEKVIAQMLVRYNYLSAEEYEKIMAVEMKNAKRNKKIWEPIILSQGIITADMEHCFFKGFSKKGGDVPGLVDENLLAVKNGFVAAEEYDSSLLRIGDYTIEKIIYEGKKYKEYKAWHEKLGKSFTIKLFNFAMSSESVMAIRWFSKEMKVIKKLRHKNIIPVHDIGVVDKQHYIAMPYISGNTLAYELDSAKKFTIHQALAIVLRLAETIGITHRHRLIHQQLTPENIIIDDSGNPYIKGFGQVTLLAKVFGRSNNTAVYHSPQQVFSNNVDVQSDVYSLGIVLYEMLMNRYPFSTPNKFWRKIQILFFDLPWHNRDVPAPVKMICKRATAKNKKYRYIDGFKMAMDIRCYLNKQPLASGTFPWHYSFITWMRHRILYFVTFTLVALMFVGYKAYENHLSANNALQIQKKLSKSIKTALATKNNHQAVRKLHLIINEYKVLLSTNAKSSDITKNYVQALKTFFELAIHTDVYLTEYALFLLQKEISESSLSEFKKRLLTVQKSKGQK